MKRAIFIGKIDDSLCSERKFLRKFAPNARCLAENYVRFFRASVDSPNLTHVLFGTPCPAKSYACFPWISLAGRILRMISSNIPCSAETTHAFQKSPFFGADLRKVHRNSPVSAGSPFFGKNSLVTAVGRRCLKKWQPTPESQRRRVNLCFMHMLSSIL